MPLAPCTLQDAAARFASSFGAALDALLADPSAPAPGHPDCHPLNCYNLCKLRCVRRRGCPIRRQGLYWTKCFTALVQSAARAWAWGF